MEHWRRAFSSRHQSPLALQARWPTPSRRSTGEPWQTPGTRQALQFTGRPAKQPACFAVGPKNTLPGENVKAASSKPSAIRVRCLQLGFLATPILTEFQIISVPSIGRSFHIGGRCRQCLAISRGCEARHQCREPSIVCSRGPGNVKEVILPSFMKTNQRVRGMPTQDPEEIL